MDIDYRSSVRAGGDSEAGGLFLVWAYGIDKQLFARRPLGKIWAGRAALENVTGVEGCGKRFRKVADPPVPFFPQISLFQNFPYMEKLDFCIEVRITPFIHDYFYHTRAHARKIFYI